MENRYTSSGESQLPPQPQLLQPPPLSGYAGYTKPWFRPGNDCFSKGIAHTSEYFGLGIGRANGDFQILNNVHQEIQRELEKERIRDEIIAAEIARRRVLEAEVRAELRMERELALRMRGGNAFDRFLVPVGAGVSKELRGISFVQEIEGLPLDERVAMYSEERLRMRARSETQEFGMVPFQQRDVESKFKEATQSRSESGNQKEKIIFLAKPSANLSGTKRKVESPAKESANKFSAVGNKKGKKDWRCVVCQVNATGERALSDHFQGKKHKSKEAALEAERNGSNIGFAVLPKKNKKPITEFGHLSSPPQAVKVGGQVQPVNQSEPPSLHVVLTKCLDENIAQILPENEEKHISTKKEIVGIQRIPKSKERKNFTYWCKSCQVGAYSEKVMEAHRIGKKHLKMLQKTRQTDEASKKGL